MTIPLGYAKRLLAGALFGLYVGNLLYFLNPQIDVSATHLFGVTFVYALICALLFGTLLWLLRFLRVKLFGRPEEDGQKRQGFGFVVLAAFLSAAVYYAHLEMFRIYLPVAAVRLLSNATIIISAVAFVLFVLWFFERNTSRATAQVLFVAGCVVVVISSVLLDQRRDRYHAVRKETVVANVGTIAGENRVVVVAIDRLPYDWIVTLTGEGSLPFFDRASSESFFTRVEPFPTTSAKALWASLATGKLPYRHGVTGRFSYRTLLTAPGERYLLLPAFVGFRGWGLIPPVERISARLPSGDAHPLWQLFSRVGFGSAVVNWPGSSPPDRSAAVAISDRFFSRGAELTEAWPPEEGAIAKPLVGGVPRRDAMRFNELPTRQREAVVGSLARDLSVRNVAAGLLSAHRETIVIAAFDGLATSEQALRAGNKLPPASTRTGAAIRNYVAELDAILDAIDKGAPGATIVVVSPSGPEPPVLPGTIPTFARWIEEIKEPGSDDGFLVVRGPGAAHRDNPPSAHVTDVVPTALFAAGLPIARDMDGRVVSEAFSDEMLRGRSLSIIETYDADRLVVRRTR